ncbi:MAG: PD-(D/E)XK nuclease family protein [Verrucomicrobiota bacterium]|nr:PD-(D/E)XK nuclease family protein [Verrucomicrobiota bacterium]
MPDSPQEQGELPLFNPPLPSPSETSTDSCAGGSELEFLGWSEPVIQLTVDYLTRDWDTCEPIDLSKTQLIVPTRNAGRRVREALAIRAAEYDTIVFPPLVTTPEYLISPDRLPTGSLDLPVANSRSTHWLWAAVLLKLPLGKFRRAFPVDPVERSLRWACETADDLLQVRRLLVESGHNFASAAETLTAADMEPPRWKELAQIEEIAVEETRRCGFADEASAQLSLPEKSQAPADLSRVILCGISDLRPLAADVLRTWSSQMPVQILVHAPESESPRFDRFGRPAPEAWINSPITIPDPDTTIHRAVSPKEQAELAYSLLSELDQIPATAAIGIPDPDLTTPLQETLSNHGLKGYDPGGRALAGEGIYYLLKQVADTVTTNNFSSFRLLLNCPGFCEAILRDLPETGDTALTPNRLINAIDDLIIRTLPTRLDDAFEAAQRTRGSHCPQLAGAIDWMRKWRNRFREEDFEDTLNDLLSSIYHGRRYSRHNLTQAVLSEVAEAILTLSEELAAISAAFKKKPGPGDRFELLITSLASKRVYPEREPDEVDLQGWLELLWEDAPRLVVSGMNDHAVPEAIVGHAFLPDTARQKLGVQNNDDRFARDAYFLTSLIHSRSAEGRRIDLIFGRESASGDPLRPSRLLFQCSAEELPARTLQLFRDIAPETQPAARSIAFQLKPRPLAKDNRIFQYTSPTALKQYLACPFRFYLNYGLRMSKVEIDKREMDAADFGNLVHHSLEEFARSDEAIGFTERKAIVSFLHEEVDRQLYRQFGSELSTPIVIQRDSARKRLGWWAAIEAEQREAGWQIVSSEDTFGDDHWPFQISGLTVTGRIDRIERHPEHGIRVVDFKTFSPGSSSHRKTVDTYHLAPLKRTESETDFPEWMMVENDEGKLLRWTDLQLPLYVLAMREREPETKITAAYATLGKSEAEVAIDEWQDLDDRLLDEARNCAEGVIEAIRKEQFWPASEDAPPWDDFKDLLQPMAKDAVDPNLLGQ